jgi:hypothetical protein
LSTAGVAVSEAFLYIFWVDRHHRGPAQRGRSGLGAHPSLRQRHGGPRPAGPERISGHRKPHPKRPAKRPTDALRRRASRARRDWSSPGSQRFRRGRHRRPAGHDPGLVPHYPKVSAIPSCNRLASARDCICWLRLVMIGRLQAKDTHEPDSKTPLRPRPRR